MVATQLDYPEPGFATTGHPIRVLIADDSAPARAGLRALLSTWPEVEVLGEALNGQQAVRFVEEHQPAIVLMDIRMPILDGVEAARLIKCRWPDVGIIVVTINATEEHAALCGGADAFLVKGDAPGKLRMALHAARGVDEVLSR